MLLDPGDVVMVDFQGAQGIKRRPAVVVSSAIYHRERPDLILGLLTSNLKAATSTTDHILMDLPCTGLRLPTAFRSYFFMALPQDVRRIGELSPRDFAAVRTAFQAAFM